MFRSKDAAANFAVEFLERYTSVGFGALPKREVDLMIVDLLHRHLEGFSDKPDFEAALMLRTTKRRLRGLRDDVSYRSIQSEDLLKAELREELKRAEVVGDDHGMVRVQIDDAVLRNYAEALVRSEFGLVDTSFNSAILRLSGEKFLLLAYRVLSEAERAEAERTIESLSEAKTATGGDLSDFKRFRNAFVSGAGGQAGKLFVSGAVALVSGGASVILETAEPIQLAGKRIGEALKAIVKSFRDIP